MTMILEEGMGGIPGYDYKAWIRSQATDDYKLEEPNDEQMIVSTEFAKTEINFYEMNIIEFRMNRFKDDETCFYLHFQLNDQDHAEQLYKEMIDVLLDQENHQMTKILLCCSAGLTTSFFAEKLTEAAASLSYDYTFEAMSVNSVYEHAKEYRAILLAPQIAYIYPKLKNMVPDSLVLKLPTAVFASYDAGAGVEFVRDEIKKEEDAKKDNSVEHLIYEEENDARAMIIAWMPDSDAVRIGYRIYHHGKVEKEDVVVRGPATYSIKDVEDIIETEICTCTGKSRIDFVGIAITGIVDNGVIHLPETDLDNQDIQTYLEKKYSIPVYVENNVNAAAYGWYGHQDKYQNVAFLSLPKGWPSGGCGFVVNGAPNRGTHAIAGELRYILRDMEDYEYCKAHAFDPEFILQLTAKYVRLISMTYDPEIILVRNVMTPDMEELKKEVLSSSSLPEEYLPELVYIPDFMEYVFLGGILLAMWRYKKGDSTHKPH